jgi:hypothetical protein
MSGRPLDYAQGYRGLELQLRVNKGKRPDKPACNGE